MLYTVTYNIKRDCTVCYLLCICLIQDLITKIEMLEEDRTEIIKEFENLQRIMSGLEKENEVILSVLCLSLHLKYIMYQYLF